MTADALARQLNARPVQGGWMAHCPGHEDREPSLSIGTGRDGRALIKCHAGCETSQVLDAAGLAMSDLYPEPPHQQAESWRETARYTYRNEHGTPVYVIVRKECGTRKKFVAQQPDGRSGLNGTRRVLYRRDEIQGRDAVFLVEGEGCAEALWGIGLAATTSPFGAGKWSDDYARQLRDAGVRRVDVLPDHDEPGRQHANQVAASCRAKDIEVRIVTLPDLPAKGDIVDWLAAGHSADELVDFAEHTSGAPVVVAEQLKVAETFPLTEAGDAEYFAARFRDRVRYDHRRGRWLVFRDHRWVAQTSGEVDRLALDAIRARQATALTIADSETRRAAQRWATAGESRKRIGNLLALAQSVLPIADSGDGWDADPFLLGVENGVLDLRTGHLRDGRPADRITMTARAPFDPDAASPLWDRTLVEIFGGDATLIDYFDRFVGYSLTGDCREEVFALCYGDGGTGKGTTLNTIGWLLGDYADDLPFSALELHERGAIPNEIAKLVGKRFVTASESGEAKRLNESRVKSLTGRDPVTARFLNREWFTFQPVAKFWLATNYRPVVRDTSLGFWRRIHMLPFTRTFADRPDLSLKDRLRAELPGILARAVRGCLAWQRDGLCPPAAVRMATESYRADSLPLAEFVKECCALRADAWTPGAALREAYAGWCRDAHEREISAGEFSEALRRHSCEPERRHAGRGWTGIGLLDRSVTP